MPVVMRDVQRRRLLARTKEQAINKATDAIAARLDQRYRALKREIRRAGFNRRQLSKRLRTDGALFKAGGEEEQDWQDWIDAFDDQLSDIFDPVVRDLYTAETQYWLTRGMRPAPVDPPKILAAYQARTGRQIKGIGKDTQDGVYKTITDWYNTDAGLPDLIDALGAFFDRDRAETIARTESSYISSQVAYDMMTQFLIKKWNWDLGDTYGEYPCETCMAQAQANPHDLDDPMPPDSSHPNCRCGISYANEDGSELIYGDDIGKLFKEYSADQPRDEGGRWTKGGGSYRQLRSTAQKGEEMHHMPAAEASPLHPLNGPAIRMPKEDHAKTASYGTSRAAREYRQQQRQLISQGRFLEAQQMDINDIRAKFGNKYDDAIKQMQDYTAKLKFSARYNMPRNPTSRQVQAWGR